MSSLNIPYASMLTISLSREEELDILNGKYIDWKKIDVINIPKKWNEYIYNCTNPINFKHHKHIYINGLVIEYLENIVTHETHNILADSITA